MEFDEGTIDILDACVVSAHRMLPAVPAVVLAVALADFGNE
jgi:hypothetical protein